MNSKRQTTNPLKIDKITKYSCLVGSTAEADTSTSNLHITLTKAFAFS